jgi:hypothetical protein
MVEWFQQEPAFVQLLQAVQANGIEPLEYIAVFSMPWRMSVRLDKPLYLFKAGNDPFFARRPAAFLLRFDFNAKLFQKGIILLREASH